MKLLLIFLTNFYVIAICGSKISLNLAAIVATVLINMDGEMQNGLVLATDLLSETLQFLINLPEAVIVESIDEICSIAVKEGLVEPLEEPEYEEISFELRTKKREYTFPIADANRIPLNKHFDVKKPVVLYISGWISDIESDDIETMAEAYNCRGGYNFLALDTSDYMISLYSWAAFNTKLMGKIVGKGLYKLERYVPAKNIHIIGYSLGAHVASFAGRYFERRTGKKIGRITGLDPAKPCFGFKSLKGLKKGDAEFVDVIHTNPGVLGESEAIGDIDFYAQGFTSTQPGCTSFFCSHSRVWEYYSESVYPGHENDFLATKCHRCQKPVYAIPMGFKTPSNGRGTYLLNVNPESPFGKNANSRKFSRCG